MQFPTLHKPTSLGFTLVELMVVMAIIGILATIGSGSFLSARVRGRDAERKNSLGQVQRAVELYYNDYNRYPPEAELNWGQAFDDAEGTVYMTILPPDPLDPDQEFLYVVSEPDGQKYQLYARLENADDRDTDLDNDGETGDEYDGSVGDGASKSCGSGVTCNYGVSSPSTTMSEAL